MLLKNISQINQHIATVLYHIRLVNYKWSSSEHAMYSGLLMKIQNFQTCEMSYDDFQEFSILKKTTIRKVIRKLEKLGFLKRIFLDKRMHKMSIRLSTLNEIKQLTL